MLNALHRFPTHFSPTLLLSLSNLCTSLVVRFKHFNIHYFAYFEVVLICKTDLDGEVKPGDLGKLFPAVKPKSGDMEVYRQQPHRSYSPGGSVYRGVSVHTYRSADGVNCYFNMSK